MATRPPRLIDKVLPDLPPEIRDDFFVHAAGELQRHSPWLFAAMFINSIIAIGSGASEAHWFVRYCLPGAMALYCLFSIATLRRNLDFANKPWRARKFLRESALSSCFGAIICTLWCVLSWISAPVEAKTFRNRTTSLPDRLPVALSFCSIKPILRNVRLQDLLPVSRGPL